MAYAQNTYTIRFDRLFQSLQYDNTGKENVTGPVGTQTKQFFVISGKFYGIEHQRVK